MGSYGQTLMQEYLELMLSRPALLDHRPEWLNGLELDLFWPALNFAVEFQGDQHFTPSFGLDALFSQKDNDRAKRHVCKERGVELLRLDAMDLEYTTLYRKLKRAFKGTPIAKYVRRREIRNRLWGINQRANAYRATLKGNYGSPTAHRKGKTRKAAKKAIWDQVPVWQIVQASQRRQWAKRASAAPVQLPPKIGGGMARAAKSRVA